MKIAVANAFGIDGLLFEERLAWFESADHWNLVDQAKEPFQYIKALYAIEDAYNGNPTGYAMGLDATSSGMQIMSLLIGCPKTASQCNVINTGRRENAYQNIYTAMKEQMPDLDYTAKQIKNVGMTVLYASKAEPKKLFGEGEELELFYSVLEDKVSGAMELMEDILACRNPNALGYEWTLPDGHTAKTKIMVTKELTITVPELEDIPVKHMYSVNLPKKKGVAIVADIVHSIDGFITREFNLRSNHDPMVIQSKVLVLELLEMTAEDRPWNGVPSITRLLDLNNRDSDYSLAEVHALMNLASDLLTYPPFEVFVVHDKFFSSPVHMQKVREHIKAIYIDIAKSNLMSNILNEITGEDVQFTKNTNNLAELMQDAEYIIS